MSLLRKKKYFGIPLPKKSLKYGNKFSLICESLEIRKNNNNIQSVFIENYINIQQGQSHTHYYTKYNKKKYTRIKKEA